MCVLPKKEKKTTTTTFSQTSSLFLKAFSKVLAKILDHSKCTQKDILTDFENGDMSETAKKVSAVFFLFFETSSSSYFPFRFPFFLVP
jgi:hypothetical protein